MRCKYVATYIAHDIALPSDVAAVDLYSSKSEGVTAALVKDPTELLRNADRGAAIINLMGRAVFGSPDPRDPEVKLAEQMATIAAERTKKSAGAPFVVIGIDFDVAADLGGTHVNRAEFSLYWDAIDKDAIRAKARPVAEGIVALAIVAGEQVRYDRIGEAIYLLDDSDRLIYSITAKMNAPSLSVCRLAPDLPALMQKYVPPSLGSDGPGLNTVFTLLRAAVDGRTEELRAFISAWSALEILTNKVFKTYEAIWFAELEKGIAPRHQLVARLREVMQGKYSLGDRFAVMSSILAAQDADADIGEFEKLRKRRNALAHSGVLSEDSLPVHGTIALVRKYLRLHLDHEL